MAAGDDGGRAGAASSHSGVLALPRRPRRGDRLEVTIETIDHDGAGEAVLAAQLGPGRQARRFRVRVRKAVVGDRLRLLVERCRRGVIEGHIDVLVEPSAMRVEPRCPHFGQREQPGKGCGGCSLQSIGYAAQVEAKRQLVQRALAEVGLRQLEVRPVRAMEHPWHYRNKMEFSFGDDRERRFALGLHPLGYRREVIDLRACYLLSPFAVTLIDGVRRWAVERGLRPYQHRRDEGWLRTLTVREGKRTGDRLVELTTSGDPEVQGDGGRMAARDVAERFAERVEQLAAEQREALTSVYWTEQRVSRGQPTRLVSHHLRGARLLRERLDISDGVSLALQVHPRAFFQPNTLQAEVLYREVLRAAGIGQREPCGVFRALDLYCGTGTIGLCLAAAGVPRITGIELSADAVDNARDNARQSGLDHRVTFHAGDVGKVLARQREAIGQVELVVVDPPRSGLLPGAVEQLGEVGAPRVVYVSCNPRALARDLALLREPGYRPVSLQPVDLFPHTAHVETVVLLERTASG